MSRLDNFEEVLDSYAGRKCPVDVEVSLPSILYSFKDYIATQAKHGRNYPKPIVCTLRGEIQDERIIVTGVLIKNYSFIEIDDDSEEVLPDDIHPHSAGSIVGIAMYCFDDPVSKHSGFVRKYHKMPLHLILNRKGEHLLSTDAEKLKWAD